MINSKLVKVNEETYGIITPLISIIINIIGIVILAIFGGIIVSSDPSLNSIIGLFTSSIITIIFSVIILGFIIGFAYYYLSAKIYNLLLPRIKGIQFELTNNNEIAKIDVVSTSVTFAIINTIWAFIIGVLLATSISTISSLISTAAILGNSGISQELVNVLNSGVIPIALLIFIVLIAFIGTFIYTLLLTVLYNIIAEHIRPTKLNIVENNNELEIKSVDVKSLILSFGLASAILSLIFGILNLASNFGIEQLITIIVSFIIILITVAITGYLYNFLSSKIYGYKFNLDPSDELTQQQKMPINYQKEENNTLNNKYQEKEIIDNSNENSLDFDHKSNLEQETKKY